MLDNIVIRGAREHNLKSIDVTIPRNKMVVITGLSGSGKSSLAFDTIYAEGQRRYVESLSAYARQFLEMMKKPDLDLIEGLSPAISIEQKTVSHNPRSTVATVTEIYDYMRLLWARVGVPYSPATGKPITSQTVSQMVDRLMEFTEGTKLMLLAPIVSDRKGEFLQEIAELRKKGYERIKVDGTVYNIDEIPPLKKTMNHSLAVVVDRVIMRPGLQTRLAGSLEKALELANGLAIGETIDGQQTLLSSKFACPVSGFTIAEIEPRIFSFNNPAGACPECSGLGMKLYIDPDLIIPDKNKSLDDGAVDSIAFFSVAGSLFKKQVLPRFKKYGVTVHTPVKNIPEELMQIILYGLPKDKDAPKEKRTGGRWGIKKDWNWEGIITNIERRYRETSSEDMREEIEKFQSQRICEACNGKRLRPEPLAVKIAGKDIAEITMLSIQDATEWFAALNGKLPKKSAAISTPILKEINDRLGFLNNVGLGYLALSRRSGTLSGGEGQRIRLASQIGSGLSGVLYVLDEPSIGLHQRDNDRLLATLKHLRDLGNTVIVVEHDTDAILAADYIFDMGPGAGAHGGYVVAEGTPAAILANKKSITGQFLSGKRSIAVPQARRKGNGNWFKIAGARANNLKNVNAAFPLGTFICVTGVSGGGKSSLVIETLYKGVNSILNHSTNAQHLYSSMSGIGYLDKVIDIDQAPIGRTPRSNPATYVGAFEIIRNWFCKLPEAQARGYGPGRFSFNVKGGRCEACEGDGQIKIEMHFLADMYVTCDVCQGKRYNRETLEIKYKGKSIADVLDLTVDEAADFFAAIPPLQDKIKMLQKVGLGYIKLGQSATTLSGGEAQRIKLAKELSKRATGKTLYILDEPTTGLHMADIEKLLEVLHTLVSQGNTVVVIEHNLDVIKTADYILDLGPEGGDKGGTIVAAGTPEEIAACKKSYTGQYLKNYLR